MERGKTQATWSSLDTLFTAGTLGSLSDGELLDHFRCGADTTGQEAFRILVERHGAMVMGVCRSLVRDPHEAEDAFQATFLVLVRRAESIRQRETIAPWLYGVARRVARRAQIRSARRRKCEVAVPIDVPARQEPEAEALVEERILQEEIRRLPQSLRAPLILCGLQGQSYDLAARRLGLRESTLRGRLYRARQRLESRLRRRGILPSIVARLLEPNGWPRTPLSSSLVESTTQFAVRWSTLSGLLDGAGPVPGSIATLAQGVINAMLLQTVRVCGLAAILTIGVVGTLVVAQQEKTGAKETTGGQAVAVNAPPQIRPILEMMKLEIKLDLPQQATLSQFLKAIKKATSDAMAPGLPMYLNRSSPAMGGGEALEAPIDCRDLKSGKVEHLLRQALGQLHLSYIVKDGFVMISSREEIVEERLDGLDEKIDRLLKMMERLEQAKGLSPSEVRKR
jgi:RNA polymerase sigma factor (sigma-70 family)